LIFNFAGYFPLVEKHGPSRLLPLTFILWWLALFNWLIKSLHN